MEWQSHFMLLIYGLINTLIPRQNGRHFADGIFKCISWRWNVWITNKMLLKFVPQGPIHNIQALVQLMPWRRLGDESLSELMMVTYRRIYASQCLNVICFCNEYDYSFTVKLQSHHTLTLQKLDVFPMRLEYDKTILINFVWNLSQYSPVLAQQ